RGDRITPDARDIFLAQCGLPPYPGLEPPRVSRSAWTRTFPVSYTSEHPLLAFLDLSPGGAAAIYRWMVRRRPVDTWPRAVQLARALRDATAHGALSASKVRQWHLLPALQTLTANIGQIVEGALGRLAGESKQALPSVR